MAGQKVTFTAQQAVEIIEAFNRSKHVFSE